MNRRQLLKGLMVAAAAPAVIASLPAPVIDANGNPVAKLIVKGRPIPVIDSPYGRVMGWYEQPDGTFNVSLALAPNQIIEINCDERQIYQMELGEIVLWQCEMNGNVTIKTGRFA